jgi:biopolymer transport protein ExbD
MLPSRYITLHRFRWPFAAARASAYLGIVAALALTDPTGSHDRSLAARSATQFTLLNRDIIVKTLQDGWVVVGTDVVPSSQLPERLGWLRLHNPQSKVVLRVTSGMHVAQVRPILYAMRFAGYERVIIETQPFYPLLLRRLAAGRSITLDRSALREPPERDDFAFSSTELWYSCARTSSHHELVGRIHAGKEVGIRSARG